MDTQLPLFSNLNHKLAWQYRRLTSKQRCLPNCLIVGAQKSGTSSLYQYLHQHPEVKKGLRKEVHYFDGGLEPIVDTFKKGTDWYKSHFPLKKKMLNSDICIDATPLYLFNPLVPSRIKNELPDCKIIILLRDPVERAISHYFHTKRHGFETLSIEQAFSEEEYRLKSLWENKNYSDLAFRTNSYKSRGLYLEQILRYQQYFSNKQLLILNSGKLYTEPQNTLKTITNFLGLDTSYQFTNLKAHNPGTNKQQVSADIINELGDYFRQPNEALFKHLGERYNWINTTR